MGALNLYAARAGALSELKQMALAAFAGQAAIALWGPGRAEALTRALASREVIGAAKGILIERQTVTDGKPSTCWCAPRRTPTSSAMSPPG